MEGKGDLLVVLDLANPSVCIPIPWGNAVILDLGLLVMLQGKGKKEGWYSIGPFNENWVGGTYMIQTMGL